MNFMRFSLAITPSAPRSAIIQYRNNESNLTRSFQIKHRAYSVCEKIKIRHRPNRAHRGHFNN